MTEYVGRPWDEPGYKAPEPAPATAQPTAADLDAVAAENVVKEQTGDKTNGKKPKPIASGK